MGEWGILSGWGDPEPTYRSHADSLDDYYKSNLINRQFRLSKFPCKDPFYMKSNTYYPPGTICFKDKSASRCATFGYSGSPIVTPFNTTNGRRFAFRGPLSISKSCDRSIQFTFFHDRYKARLRGYRFRATNPAVFTDVRCYMDWIAEQYGLKAPKSWVKPSNCTVG